VVNDTPARTTQTVMRRLTLFLRLLAILLGALYTWVGVATRSIDPDGIVYLDIADNYLAGNWQAAVNANWSPLYSWALGLTMSIMQPPMQFELLAVHLTNFVIFLGALICFEFFWTQLSEARQGSHDVVGFPDWAWQSLGFSLFIWISLNMIQVWAVLPDMLASALLYAVAGMFIRIQVRGSSWCRFAMLGLLLGFTYLTRSAFFSIAFIFLAVAWFAVRRSRPAKWHLVAGLAAFFLIAGPWIAALSNAKGRLTMGDTGKVVYATLVNGLPSHWQGGVEGYGTPDHPTRQILQTPAIYEFSAPIAGTYPVSYDGSYWYSGVIPRFVWGNQLRVLSVSGQFLFDLLFNKQLVFVMGFLVLYWMMWRSRGLRQWVTPSWTLLIPVVAALGMYALVYIEERYIGAFVLFFWASLMLNLRLPRTDDARRLFAAVSGAMLLALVVTVGYANLLGLITLARGGRIALHDASQSVRLLFPWEAAQDLEVAQGLNRLGVGPDGHVGVIGDCYQAYWARLAGTKIIAEMPVEETRTFWRSIEQFQPEVMRRFALAGADAVVTKRPPPYVIQLGWRPIADTDYYVFFP
jgi:hypothetical protein